MLNLSDEFHPSCAHASHCPSFQLIWSIPFFPCWLITFVPYFCTFLIWSVLYTLCQYINFIPFFCTDLTCSIIPMLISDAWYLFLFGSISCPNFGGNENGRDVINRPYAIYSVHPRLFRPRPPVGYDFFRFESLERGAWTWQLGARWIYSGESSRTRTLCDGSGQRRIPSHTLPRDSFPVRLSSRSVIL